MVPRGIAFYLFILSLIGLALSGWLIYIHVHVHMDPTYVSTCALGDKLNCEKVATSTYSVFAGLPVAVYGAIAFLLMAYLAAFESFGRKQNINLALLSILGITAFLVSVVLAVVSIVFIDAVCLVCTAIHVISTVFAALAITEMRKRGGLFNCYQKAFAELRKDPWPLVFGLLLGGVVLLAGPWHGFPRYWELASWRNGPQLPHGIDREGLPWLGARSPELTVHEYYSSICPACRLAHLKLRRILANHPTQIRLIRHDYSRMSCFFKRTYQEDSPLCIETRAGYCASRLKRYWDWNDAVLAKPKTVVSPTRELYEVELARSLGFPMERFERCLKDKSAFDYAQRIYAESLKKGVRFTPLYIVEDKLLNLRELVKLIGQRF